MPVIFRKEALEGQSAVGVISYPLPPGVGVEAVVEGVVETSNVPLHQHDDEEHYWFILEGSGRALMGEEEFEVGPGDLVITAPGVPHRIWSHSDRTRRAVRGRYPLRGDSAGGGRAAVA